MQLFQTISMQKNDVYGGQGREEVRGFFDFPSSLYVAESQFAQAMKAR